MSQHNQSNPYLGNAATKVSGAGGGLAGIKASPATASDATSLLENAIQSISFTREILHAAAGQAGSIADTAFGSVPPGAGTKDNTAGEPFSQSDALYRELDALRTAAQFCAAQIARFTAL